MFSQWMSTTPDDTALVAPDPSTVPWAVERAATLHTELMRVATWLIGERPAHYVINGGVVLSLAAFTFVTLCIAFRELSAIGLKAVKIVALVALSVLLAALTYTTSVLVVPDDNAQRELATLANDTLARAAKHVGGSLWNRIVG